LTGGNYNWANVSIKKPDGSTLVSATLVERVFDSQILPVTGTYTILVDPFDTSIGSATLTLTAVPADVIGTITARRICCHSNDWVEPSGFLTTTFAYDRGEISPASNDPLNHQTTLTYNTAGQPLSVTDPLQHTAQFYLRFWRSRRDNESLWTNRHVPGRWLGSRFRRPILWVTQHAINTTH